ncbi:glycosyltransferase [Sphingobacterium sp. SYP-B4668]|uniref:glycosyltransferase n=1 Tax=Sphingobacterium sp. SYP-B4668 TaxID=2996035 RepID=UPI0022DD9B39|nr:glycosyltransferase [Sphingobacterium sp. SYP-B4668]
MDNKETLRVLQLGKFYPIRGGVEKVMYELMLGLSERKIQCDMLCAATEGHAAGVTVLNSYAKLMVMPTLLKLSATMLAPRMITVLRKIAKDYQIVHIHHPDPMACLALFLSGFKGTVVLHWHADILKQKLLLKLYSPLQRWLIKRADKIVGTTPVYVEQSPFLKKVQYKIDYIPIGILPMERKDIDAACIRAKYSAKYIIFSLGRLVEYKGYEYLIRSAQHLDERYQVLIGGKGPLKEELHMLINTLGLANRVFLLGFLTDEETLSHFAASDVFCMSSIWKTEAFGIVQIEAMSLGIPVVSTSIAASGVSWVNKHGQSGLVVPPQNEMALANAIKEVCEYPDSKNKLKKGSFERFEENFTRDKMIDKCLQVYKNP